MKTIKMPSNILMNSNILPQVNIDRSTFNLSESHKTTFDGGYLIPIHWDEIYPGDTFKTNIKALARLSPLIAPIMDNVRLKFFSFFVPNRLLWDNWERFNGHRDNPSDSVDYEVPQLVTDSTGVDYGSLYDYLGVPPMIPNLSFSALPVRAYYAIFNEWFRDQNLQDSAPLSKGDEIETIIFTEGKNTLFKKCKAPDYFTTCTVSPQLGDPVILPLGQRATIRTTDQVTYFVGQEGNGQGAFRNVLGGTSITTADGVTGIGDAYFNGSTGATDGADTNLYADLTDATSSTINELRLAFQVQRVFEKDARSGTRYIEIIKSHFGVTSPDYRLQRPEYIGGGSTTVGVTPVPNTTGTDSAPQGTLAGIAVGGMDGAGYKYSATEHGIIMTVACLTADVSYQQGLPRKFSKVNRFDYMLPSFWNLGEQPVYNKEIFATGTVDDLGIFGYQQRYRELREGTNKVSGLMRSSAPTTLDVWHLVESFENFPRLNSEFIQDSVPFDRVVAVPSEPHCIADFYFEISATRPLPTNSVPGMIDHF